MSPEPGDLQATIRSEFAIVELSLVSSPSGPILKIDDQTSGRTTTLDAIELEGLCWLTPEDRERLLVPATRYGPWHRSTTPLEERS